MPVVLLCFHWDRLALNTSTYSIGGYCLSPLYDGSHPPYMTSSSLTTAEPARLRGSGSLNLAGVLVSLRVAAMIELTILSIGEASL